MVFQHGRDSCLGAQVHGFIVDITHPIPRFFAELERGRIIKNTGVVYPDISALPFRDNLIHRFMDFCLLGDIDLESHRRGSGLLAEGNRFGGVGGIDHRNAYPFLGQTDANCLPDIPGTPRNAGNFTR